jgi:hypothetical protein
VSVTDNKKANVGAITNGNTTQALLDDLISRGYKLTVGENGNLVTDPDGPPVTPVIWHAIQANYSKLKDILQPPVTDTNFPAGATIKKDNTDWSKVKDLMPARGEEFDSVLAEHVEAYQAASAVVRAAGPKDFVEGIKAAEKGGKCGKCGRSLKDDETVYAKCRVYAGMWGGLMSRPGARFDNVSVCEGCAPEWLVKPKAFHEYTIGGRTVRVPESRRVRARPCSTCERPVVYEVTGRNYRSSDVFCSHRCEYTYHNRRHSRRTQKLREKVCEVCSKDFTATRVDQKTCSSACKQKAYRQRKNA